MNLLKLIGIGLLVIVLTVAITLAVGMVAIQMSGCFTSC